MAGIAFTVGGFAGSLLAFVVAAITIVLLLLGVSYAVGTAQECVVARLRANAPAVKRWGGYILIGVGAWFIILSVFADFFSRIFPV